MTLPDELTEAQIDAVIEAEGTSPARRYALERALRPVTTAEQWLATYERWKDRGVNLEGLLMQGQAENWIPADVAQELIG